MTRNDLNTIHATLFAIYMILLEIVIYSVYMYEIVPIQVQRDIQP